MVKKKEEEVEETAAETGETQAAEELGVEVNAEDSATVEAAGGDASTEAAGDEASAEAAPATEDAADETSSAEAKPTKEKAAAVPEAEKAIEASTADAKTVVVHKRAEKIGIVSSDKMTKTVVVRVDRLVKHPIYRKYVKKRKKFMAHDELGATIGDKVKIIETRPLSARKRWRVVEIIQKAQS